MLTQSKSKGFGCDQTPLSNTGSNSQKLQNTSLGVRVDWLQGTMSITGLKQLHEILEFIEGYTGERFVLHPGQGRFIGKQWQNHAQGIEGCVVCYNLPDEEKGDLGHLFLSFTATVLSSMSARDIWRMVSGLMGRGKFNLWRFKPTRFDIALDDYAMSITYDQVAAAAKVKNYTGFRLEPDFHHTFRKGQIVGFTITFGTRKSDRLLRFYDKLFQSKGRIKSYRWELELHDKLAEAAVEDWLAIEPENFEEFSPKLLAGMVVGTMNFVQRGHDKNVSRMPILDWWQSFKDKVGMEIRHSIGTVATSFERKKEWCTRQVFVTLAMFESVMGIQGFKQYLRKEIGDARERFTTYNEVFINKYRVGIADMDYSWDVCNE